MSEWIIDREPAVRLGAFVAVFAAVALCELGAARRQLRAPKGKRWLANLSLVAFNSVVLRLLFPTAALGMAVLAADRGWGLLNNIAIPAPLAFIAAIVFLDFVIYLQHVVFHAIPIFWRLHRVHHADLDFDVTTGARFHPAEIVLSMAIKFAVIAMLGPPAAAVVVFEVLLNGTSMFNHGNVRLPLAVDRVLRWFLVTPDMHRVHHSVVPAEHNSNFGFNLPWWDRLLGTYRDQPAAGHQGMTIGLPELQKLEVQSLPRLLAFPLLHPPGPVSNQPARAASGHQSRTWS